MIADIIKEVYSGEGEAVFKELLEESIVCGCLFRSFDDFTQHLIFLMYANQGMILLSEIIGSMQNSPFKAEGRDRLASALANLSSIKIINSTNLNSEKIILNESFAAKLNYFIIAPAKNFGELHNFRNDQFFNLLLLLRESNQILKQCRIGSMTMQANISKQNFDFIRLPIGYKISILIKGYLKSKRNLKERRITLKNILLLSEMDCNRKYRIIPENVSLIFQLEKIHLVRKVQEEFFVISPYLHNFAFEEKKNTKLLNCSIIIETNFKVYVQIPKAGNSLNYQLIREIVRNLIKIDHEDYELQELIVGEITQQMMRGLFIQNISVVDYFSFFLEYMSSDLKIEKDLGKWNKIKFLGLQGPENEMMIPNNVKQQLKLWESISRSSNPRFYIEDNRLHPEYYDHSDS